MIKTSIPELSSNLVIHNDSIYIVDTNLEALVISDLNGSQSYARQIKYSLDSLTGPYTSLTFLPYYNPAPISDSSDFILNISTVSLNSSGILNGEPIFGILDRGMRFTPITPFYSGILSEKGNSRYPYDLTFPYFLLREDHLVVNFPLDHHLYLYDLKKRALTDEKVAASVHNISIPLPYSQETAADHQQVWNFRMTTPFYEPLFYHEAVKLYSRAVHHPQKLKLTNGKLNDGAERKTSVIILDERLKKVGEVTFEGGEYTIHGAAPTSDGLLLYSRDYGPGEFKIPNRKFSFKPSPK